MGKYLLQSMSLLKRLGSTNAALRQAYTGIYRQNNDSKAMNDALMAENADLRQKAG